MNKTAAILSYVTIFGWLYAYFTTQDNRDSLVRYHLKQSLGLMIIWILFGIILNVLAHMIPALGFLGLLSFGFTILWIFGIINAANEAEKPIPLIGKMFEDKFNFI